MKRGGPDHPKLRLLASKLSLTRYQVVGVMESIFHFTASYSKRGNIGKWSDDEISSAIGWEKSPQALIDALVECRLIDRCPTYRLIVHDWKEHADQTVLRSEDVKKLGFVSVQLAYENGNQSHASQPTPTPEPEPEPRAASKPRFVKPTQEEVRAYCSERKNHVDPQAFLDFYESKGWVVGKSPMKDWKASVRTWEKKAADEGQGTLDLEPNFL